MLIAINNIRSFDRLSFSRKKSANNEISKPQGVNINVTHFQGKASRHDLAAKLKDPGPIRDNSRESRDDPCFQRLDLSTQTHLCRVRTPLPLLRLKLRELVN